MRLIFGGTVDGDEVVLTGAGDADVADLDHFLDTHLVIDHGDFWEIEVIEAGKHFVDVHLGDAVRGFAKAVVAQVQSQGLSDVGKGFFNALVFFVALVLMRKQRSLEATLEQGMTNLVSLFGIGRRKFCRGLGKIAFHVLSFWSLVSRERDFLFGSSSADLCQVSAAVECNGFAGQVAAFEEVSNRVDAFGFAGRDAQQGFL
jgi:hypothetical protein